MTDTPTKASPEAQTDSPPYRWALLAGAVVGLLYALTLAPTTAFWDTSEYIATGHILGIPHPPGNPLFVLLARAWSVLLAPLGLSVADLAAVAAAKLAVNEARTWAQAADGTWSHVKGAP